jgi:acetyl-CoA synthetase
MTRGFWNDPERYCRPTGRASGYVGPRRLGSHRRGWLWYILGRSDDTIKIAGKRLGPAEVESVLVDDPAVLEAAAIGVPDEMKGQALVCFVVLRPGSSPGAELTTRLTTLVIDRLGKPLKPKAIEFVRESAEDTQRQGHAPRDSCGVSRR